LQRGLTAVKSRFECWNSKLNKAKTQAISQKDRVPEDISQLNGRNISFVNNVKYFGVIFDSRMTWRFHFERATVNALVPNIGNLLPI
jgi:hypothetical protein